MEDPQAILSRAREGSAPSTWSVFTKKRERYVISALEQAIGRRLRMVFTKKRERYVISILFGKASNDPDPLLVVTPEGVIEYINENKPLSVIYFADLADVRLRWSNSWDSDEDGFWLDLYSIGEQGSHRQWHSSSFKDNDQVFHCFSEAYGAYKALHRKP